MAIVNLSFLLSQQARQVVNEMFVVVVVAVVVVVVVACCLLQQIMQFTKANLSTFLLANY